MKPITEVWSSASFVCGDDQSLAARAVLLLLRGYKILISPHFRGSCRFLPSCADYAAEAVARHGAICGSCLAAWRLARCHPLCPAGHDPVPSRTWCKSGVAPRAAAVKAPQPSISGSFEGVSHVAPRCLQRRKWTSWRLATRPRDVVVCPSIFGAGATQAGGMQRRPNGIPGAAAAARAPNGIPSAAAAPRAPNGAPSGAAAPRVPNAVGVAPRAAY